MNYYMLICLSDWLVFGFVVIVCIVIIVLFILVWSFFSFVKCNKWIILVVLFIVEFVIKIKEISWF